MTSRVSPFFSATGAAVALACAACGSGGETKPFGLETRPAVPALAFPLAVPGSGIARFVDAFPAVPAFVEPVFVGFAPGDTTHVYVVERAGKILRVENDPAATEAEVFLDLPARVGSADHEEGLLGLAFHPSYATNGTLFLRYVRAGTPPQPSVLSRLRATADRTRADPASEVPLLEIDGPAQIHRGGMLAFGPDGTLFASIGDGGDFRDPHDAAQDLARLHGKLLRIDVDRTDPGLPYAVPGDNPFVGTAGARPEIWAFGLRNPWRFSIDRATGEIWLGDVGNWWREEVNVVTRGGNYGWRPFEGTGVHTKRNGFPPDALPPLHEYLRPTGSCVIGGHVYRGAAIPALAGAYVYGDHGSGRVWALTRAAGNVTSNVDLDVVPDLTSFGEDAAGELYACALVTGRVSRLVASEPSPAPPFPARLSETGIYADLAALRSAPGLVPYEVNAPLWSDGAEKDRFFALPGAERITFQRDAPWWFPTGTVLVKTFRLPLAGPTSRGTVPIETRVLVLSMAGWRGYSYRWREDGSDADLLEEASERALTVADPLAPSGTSQRTWSFPARTDCLRCHTTAAGHVLGLTTLQANRPFDFDGVVDGQLRAWEHAGLLEGIIPARDLAAHAAPEDTTARPAERARSYLDANCAMCHRPGGPGGGSMDLRANVATAKMGVLDALPIHGDLDVPAARLVRPGKPEESVLWLRMRAAHPRRMPPLATSVVDEAGSDLVRRWIEGGP